jgi:hypothetical protein
VHVVDLREQVKNLIKITYQKSNFMTWCTLTLKKNADFKYRHGPQSATMAVALCGPKGTVQLITTTTTILNI